MLQQLEDYQIENSNSILGGGIDAGGSPILCD